MGEPQGHGLLHLDFQDRIARRPKGDAVHGAGQIQLLHPVAGAMVDGQAQIAPRLKERFPVVDDQAGGHQGAVIIPEIGDFPVDLASGVAFGMGYIAYGVLALLCLGVIFLALSSLKLFDHASLQEEKLLRITIPESLDYARVFDDTFSHYLKSVENAGVKTTGMGSMFRLSFKIRMKNPAEEKEMIDELRTKNGNLEISVLPYAEQQNQL